MLKAILNDKLHNTNILYLDVFYDCQRLLKYITIFCHNNLVFIDLYVCCKLLAPN